MVVVRHAARLMQQARIACGARRLFCVTTTRGGSPASLELVELSEHPQGPRRRDSRRGVEQAPGLARRLHPGERRVAAVSAADEALLLLADGHDAAPVTGNMIGIPSRAPRPEDRP